MATHTQEMVLLGLGLGAIVLLLVLILVCKRRTTDKPEPQTTNDSQCQLPTVTELGYNRNTCMENMVYIPRIGEQQLKEEYLTQAAYNPRFI